MQLLRQEQLLPATGTDSHSSITAQILKRTTHHSLVQLLRQEQQLLALALHQLGHRDARPLGDDLCDVCLRHLLLQQLGAASFTRLGSQRLLSGLCV